MGGIRVKVMVVGSGGEIGYYVHEYLKMKGYEVVPVVRSSNGPLLSRYDIRPVIFDPQNSSPIKDALTGCDAVVNCIIYKQSSGRPGELVEKNVKFARRLLDLVTRAKVKKMLHLSSIAVLPPKITTADLISASSYSRDKDWYTRSKIETERVFLGGGNDLTSTIVIRPGIVYGPNMNWSRTAFSKVAKHTVILPDVENYCYAAHALDIARLLEHLILYERPDIPRIVYGANPERISWADFFSRHAMAIGLQDRISLMPVESLKSRWGKISQSPIQNAAVWVLEKRLMPSFLVREGRRFIFNMLGDTLKAGSPAEDEGEFLTPLFPTPSDFERYQTNGDIAKAETGSGLQFNYRVSLKQGSENAALWRANSFLTN